MQMLEFEKPVAELEAKIEELRRSNDGSQPNLADEMAKLQQRLEKQLKQLYAKLTPAQKVQVARHPNRPHCRDYIAQLISDFTPLAGDRAFAEDHAIIGGLGRLQGQALVILGQERGHDTDSRIKHNFGMARPEGYRKAIRLMQLAERFRLPIVTLVDTAGAFPGVDAEARGQAEAIARGIETCLTVKVPVVSCIIGEGGSGGAIAIAAGDRVLMLEHAIYSVISPEGCASILWRSATHAAEAAAALRLTAQDLLQLGLIDKVIAEPLGGAQRGTAETIAQVGDAISESLAELLPLSGEALVTQRQDKYLAMGKKTLN
ncbi:MAG: acetyl-CoA carboxylase carboxyltransferase subunit alpha [Alphaproteobacteria bacterium]|nr:acetyl-CoA carboxylase carboxyltransferase subunit alpha [Alphaproteobacteria bacterium]